MSAVFSLTKPDPRRHLYLPLAALLILGAFQIARPQASQACWLVIPSVTPK